MGAIAQLKTDQANAKDAGKPVGQVLMTTHSDVALGEAGATSLRVIQTSRPGRAATIAHPNSPDPIRALMRFTPSAMFARRILVDRKSVVEGKSVSVRVDIGGRRT